MVGELDDIAGLGGNLDNVSTQGHYHPSHVSLTPPARAVTVAGRRSPGPPQFGGLGVTSHESRSLQPDSDNLNVTVSHCRCHGD